MQIKFLLPSILMSLAAATLCSAATIDRDPLAVAQRLKPVVGSVTTPDGTVLSYRLFNHTQPAYANATPVIFVGGTGIGLSTVTNDSLVTRENMGNDIHELAKHFNWTHINLVGISMGAIVSNTL
ncbi:hypothetical protein BGZ97_011738 [Linnemannia gamsii]|uniref:AB hydrolase-1 domain-containing protein n=1 Tax=Linnemannia gamsii TaxID=64522 RepID=A0A9P6R733_9FUNG|nr:hypothetical protein BGZ97_011738 [Linnemannia gamsii]